MIRNHPSAHLNLKMLLVATNVVKMLIVSNTIWEWVVEIILVAVNLQVAMEAQVVLNAAKPIQIVHHLLHAEAQML